MDTGIPQKWMSLLFVIATLYILIFYIFTPSKNECQMTFMMEPPRFIPIPIDDSSSVHLNHGQPVSTSESKIAPTKDYQLFMYNEFGFPSSSNIHTDLKDSMPVLFVPGNAGSYQQVRSIASTSIRHQLQSLDAFKFIFYTIDFKGQLSGFSGKLIEEQTKFVHRALKQIFRIHPDHINGTILVGHSVGGFISKLLFTEPDFNQDSIPLMISLASPLIKPYLAFDDTLHQLYSRANSFWSSGGEERKTISISITGGRADRLMPFRLSMDTSYDLALTTGSIRDVWLSADHVCITWCRELMYKLSHLLSKLMDKKKTQIISDKDVALTVVREELLHDQNVEEDVKYMTVWKSRRTYKLVELEHEYCHLDRTQMMNDIVITNVSSIDRVLVSIDHIMPIKLKEIFSCVSVEIDDATRQIICNKRVDLMSLSRRIPTKKFDTMKTVIHLSPDRIKFEYNFIILNFNQDGRSRGHTEDSLPEGVTIQRLDQVLITKTWIPSLVELIVQKFLPSRIFDKMLSPPHKNPMSLLKMELYDLDHPPIAITFTTLCDSKQPPAGLYVQLYNGNYLEESFQPTLMKDNAMITTATVEPDKLYRFRKSYNESNQRILEIYLDGRCNTMFSVDLIILDTYHYLIRNYLDDMIICLTYLVCTSILASTFYLRASVTNRLSLPIESKVAQMLTYISVSMTQFLNFNSSLIKLENHLFRVFMLYTLTVGIFISMSFIMRRIIDIATILDCVHHKLRAYIRPNQSVRHYSANGTARGRSMNDGSAWHRLDWLMVMLAIAGSTIASNCFISTVTLFSAVKCGLCIELSSCERLESHRSENKHIKKHGSQPQRLEQAQLQVLNIELAVLMAIVLLTNLPQAIVQLRTNEIYENLLPRSLNETFIKTSAVLSVILTKLINDRILKALDSRASKNEATDEKANGVRPCTKQDLCFFDYMSLLTKIVTNTLVLLPMEFLRSNICRANYILMATLILVVQKL